MFVLHKFSLLSPEHSNNNTSKLGEVKFYQHFAFLLWTVLRLNSGPQFAPRIPASGFPYIGVALALLFLKNRIQAKKQVKVKGFMKCYAQ